MSKIAEYKQNNVIYRDLTSEEEQSLINDTSVIKTQEQRIAELEILLAELLSKQQ